MKTKEKAKTAEEFDQRFDAGADTLAGLPAENLRD